MISDFKETDVKDTGVIYSGMFEQIKKLYAFNQELAGEFAISCLEYVLTGTVSSDDFTIETLLESYKPIIRKAEKRYKDSCFVNRERKIDQMRLNEIAKYVRQGMKQKDIAAELNIPESTVSYRVRLLYKDEYKDLLKTWEEVEEEMRKKGINLNLISPDEW